MKVGLIARSEDRGLGVLTRAFYEAMEPDRVLLIDPGRLARGFAQNPDRYPGATVVPWEGGDLPEEPVRGWLRGLDVVYTAETLYDPRIASWAAQAGARVVCHVMPEFFGRDGDLENVTWWAPTAWRLDQLPAGTRLVPVPLTGAVEPDTAPERLRVIHVAGHRAASDRNGTSQFLAAVRLLRAPMDVTVWCQDRRLPSTRPASPRVRYRARLGGVADRWAMYADADVLVLPRRYGGLCLPVLEALTVGLGVVLPDVPPNGDWPVALVPPVAAGSLRTVAGELPLVTVPPKVIAMAVELLAGNREALADLRRKAYEWALAHTWEALAPRYRAELAAAVAS